MALMKPSESWAVTAQGAAERQGFAARSELRLRNAMEAFLRARYPVARICHEMVMGEREVRADIVAICPDHIAAVEVKGEYDKVTRLLHQAGMYQLSVPEVWLLTSDNDHCDDAATIRYLIPSLGLITATGIRDRYNTADQDCVLTVVAEPVPRQQAHKEQL